MILILGMEMGLFPKMLSPCFQMHFPQQSSHECNMKSCFHSVSLSRSPTIQLDWILTKISILPFTLLCTVVHSPYLSEQLCLAVNISWLVSSNSLKIESVKTTRNTQRPPQHKCTEFGTETEQNR